jgi:1-acyl-sn-glycerol-3-phosphate acyltransferase
VGDIPKDLQTGIFAVCPHNTWKDFFVGLGARATMNLKIGYLGKEELFRPPFGFIFRWLGGRPVKRQVNTNLVESQVNVIKTSNIKMFALAPEGTRGNVSKLRTGFYYIALGANIPIVILAFDFEKKHVVYGGMFLPTGDFKKDMQQYFVPFFKTIGGFQKDWVKNYENGIFE